MAQKSNTMEEILRVGFYERFASKIIPEPNSGCWIWMGNTNNYGYGLIMFSRKLRPAHRVSYECVKGEIPDGLAIDHLCRVTHCVNPDHLEAVTQAENNRRQHFARRDPKFQSEDVCFNGHPWTEETRKIQYNGTAACRECQRYWTRMAMRKYRATEATKCHN